MAFRTAAECKNAVATAIGSVTDSGRIIPNLLITPDWDELLKNFQDSDNDGAIRGFMVWSDGWEENVFSQNRLSRRIRIRVQGVLGATLNNLNEFVDLVEEVQDTIEGVSPREQRFPENIVSPISADITQKPFGSVLCHVAEMTFTIQVEKIRTVF